MIKPANPPPQDTFIYRLALTTRFILLKLLQLFLDILMFVILIILWVPMLVKKSLFYKVLLRYQVISPPNPPMKDEKI